MVPPAHIAHELLSKAHPPEVAAAIFTDKVLHKPLHLQPSTRDPNSGDARAQRRLVRVRKEVKVKKRLRVKPLSAKEKRVLGIHDIPKGSRKYEIYEPLHRMWLGYMREILGFEDGKSAYISAQTKGSLLASADYHGAQVLVIRARCAGLVGLEGIVVKDTKFTFQLITKRNELKSKPVHDFWMKRLMRRSHTKKIHNLPIRNTPNHYIRRQSRRD